MPRIAFADESGTADKPACYAIGMVSLDEAQLGGFNDRINELKSRHGIVGEAKWSKIGTGHGAINLLLDLTQDVLVNNLALVDIIVVRTADYRLWNQRGADREVAFYKTYTQLVRHVADGSADSLRVVIDERSDSYPLQHEVMSSVGNRMLVRMHGSGRISGVVKAPSSENPGIQAADLLTGAFAAAHRIWMDPSASIHPGKHLALARMAELFGWNDLCCDTFPSRGFNIWHFPIEFRGSPTTRGIVPRTSVPYVDREALAALRTPASK